MLLNFFISNLLKLNELSSGCTEQRDFWLLDKKTCSQLLKRLQGYC